MTKGISVGNRKITLNRGLTSSRSGKLNKPQNGIIARHRLERDIGMPALFAALLLPARVQECAFVDLLGLHRADDANFVIGAAVLPASIDDWMYMQRRGARLAGELAEALGQLFLEIIIERVLGAEENDAALGYWFEMSIYITLEIVGVTDR